MIKFKSAGRINIKTIIPTIPRTPVVFANRSNTPTSPLVPIPPPDAPHFNANTQVDSGPHIALDIIIGSIIWGFFIIFGICNIEVPSPCAIRPPQRFSLKLATAKRMFELFTHYVVPRMLSVFAVGAVTPAAALLIVTYSDENALF